MLTWNIVNEIYEALSACILLNNNASANQDDMEPALPWFMKDGLITADDIMQEGEEIMEYTQEESMQEER